MNTINLSTTVTSDPDFGAFRFYVGAGDAFDASTYAEAYSLNITDLDADDVHAAQDKAAQLNDGEWLEVSHEVQRGRP